MLVDKAKGQRINVACGECKRKTLHLVLASADESGSDDDIQYLALEVVEHLLQGVYILPYHAKKTFV